MEDTTKEVFSSSGRTVFSDVMFAATEYIKVEFKNLLLIRAVAKNRTFKEIDFSFTIFDSCYFRGCTFDSCNFTGCKFIGCNFRGANFTGCTFEYSVFERTIIGSDILNYNMPERENVALELSRSLKSNYSQLGDIKGYNKAIVSEINLTRDHLYKSWHSNDRYYRKKYASVQRFLQFLYWLSFKFSDYLWGHGEKMLNLLFAVLWVCVLIGVVHFNIEGGKLMDSFIESISIFLGNAKPSNFPIYILNFVTFIRFVFIALFVSIFVKKLGYR